MNVAMNVAMNVVPMYLQSKRKKYIYHWIEANEKYSSCQSF